MSVSPAAKLGDTELLPGAPDNSVVLVTGAGATLVTLPVAVPDGSKKSWPAAIAEAATSVVLASLPTAVFSAVFRLPAVAAGFAPMVKLPAGGGCVFVAVNWTEADLRKLSGSDQSKKAGEVLAGRAKEAGIESAVFDRNGYLYHGRVQAFAEGVREGGLSV